MQSSTLNGLGILIVEDDPLLRRQATAVLQQLGVDVTSAPDLRAARQFAANLDLDFALLDLNLPDGLSMELLKERAFPPSTGSS